MEKLYWTAYSALAAFLLAAIVLASGRPTRALVIQVPMRVDGEFNQLIISSPAFQDAEVTRSPGLELRLITITSATNLEVERRVAALDREVAIFEEAHGAELWEHDRLSGFRNVCRAKYFSSVPRFR